MSDKPALRAQGVLLFFVIFTFIVGILALLPGVFPGGWAMAAFCWYFSGVVLAGLILKGEIAALFWPIILAGIMIIFLLAFWGDER